MVRLKAIQALFTKRNSKFPLRTKRPRILQPTSFSHPHILKEGEITPFMHASEFASRRRKLFSQEHSATSTADMSIVISNPQLYISEDIPVEFRQSSNMRYYSGLLEPESLIVMWRKRSGGEETVESTLFLRGRSESDERFHCPRLEVSDAASFLGVENASPLDALERILPRILRDVSPKQVHVDGGCPDLLKRVRDILNDASVSVAPPEDTSDWLYRPRLVKSEAELSSMRMASEIASKAMTMCISETREGIPENAIRGIFEKEIRLLGADRMSFPPVVASGANATTMHYIVNDDVAREGEMILLDAGCEWNGYASDITRTWPVSGTFSPVQRALYEAVLDVQLTVLQATRSGKTLVELMNLMFSELRHVCVEMKLMKPSDDPRSILDYCPHGVGHMLGLDTHDVRRIPNLNRVPLASGMVVTVEPGLYIPSDFHRAPSEFHGIGIRIEDDVAVTSSEPEVLTALCPKTADEVMATILQ
eukprot:Rmarinus@m.7360